MSDLTPAELAVLRAIPEGTGITPLEWLRAVGRDLGHKVVDSLKHRGLIRFSLEGHARWFRTPAGDAAVKEATDAPRT